MDLVREWEQLIKIPIRAPRPLSGPAKGREWNEKVVRDEFESQLQWITVDGSRLGCASVQKQLRVQLAPTRRVDICVLSGWVRVRWLTLDQCCCARRPCRPFMSAAACSDPAMAQQ
eukprot:101406-Amphidinium_carterae.5